MATCPACNGEGRVVSDIAGMALYCCTVCDALFGRVERMEQTLELISNRWCSCKEPTDNTRYYDLWWPVGRIHGWQCLDCGNVRQSG